VDGRYRDRAHAGQVLAGELIDYTGRDDLVVLGLARGGVPVAAEVAARLHAPLDAFLVRKLGAPGNRELAMGAIASGGARVLNDTVVRGLNVSWEEIEATAAREEEELARRERRYRDGRPPPDLAGKTVVLVDDGLATGSSMRVAIEAVARQRPAAVVVAVPVGARQTCDELAALADEVVCPLTPVSFYAVGEWYEDFSPPTDEAIRELLVPPPGGNPPKLLQ
jgi:predicted phosphoribosyltransferase